MYLSRVQKWCTDKTCAVVQPVRNEGIYGILGFRECRGVCFVSTLSAPFIDIVIIKTNRIALWSSTLLVRILNVVR